MQSKIFYSASLGFFTGVLWRSFFRFDSRAALFFGIGSALLILFFAVLKKNLKIILVFVFALAFSLGILRFQSADRPAPEIFQRQLGQKISLLGLISERPAEKESNLEIIAEAAQNGAKTKILLFVPKTGGDYRYGDEINFTGKLEKPKNFLTAQDKEFDYANYLRKEGIFYLMRYPKTEVVSRGYGNFIKSALYGARQKLAGTLASIIPEPESLLMRALILGERSSFSDSLRQAFVNTGTIHIVTISGYHIALVAGWIMRVLGFMPINFAIGGGIFAVFLYVIMTGGAQSAIRAGIMAALALFARATGRARDAGRALVLAAVIMVLLNPLVLAFDVSFELSFLATIAVIFFTPKIEKYFRWIKWEKLRELVSLTSAAYIFVLPFLLYKTGILSAVSLPANVAILPLIPATMILGFATGFLGIISRALALIPGKIAYFFLYYELAAVGFFSRLSFASFSVPNFPFALTLLVYAVFFYYLFSAPPKLNEKTGGSLLNPEGTIKEKTNLRFVLLAAAFLFTIIFAGFLSYRHYESNQTSKENLQALLASYSTAPLPFEPGHRIKDGGCILRGALPDRECTPGAVFAGASVEQICVRGYTQTVRNVSTNLRKDVFAEYGIAYPQPRGAYEIDHLIPLALGGSNDIDNLFPEAAEPAPGFHEKDVVEIYLQQEVCSGRVALPIAQRQISNDWLAVYNNLSPEEIIALKKKYGGK